MAAAADPDAVALVEITTHAAWWNAIPAIHRERLLQAALTLETSAFVALSNALEHVPTLSAADTEEMVTGITVMSNVTETTSPQQRAALNTYRAHRLAHAFRCNRVAAKSNNMADEMLWHMPEVLAVHRELLRGLHARAGILRVTETRPSDRDRLYVSARAVAATTWSFFDVLNSKLINQFDDISNNAPIFGHCDEEDVMDEDGAVCEDECAVLIETGGAPREVRDVDASKVKDVAKLAAWAVLHLLEIHPFTDGNGRLARILIDVLLASIHPVPVPLVPFGDSILDARTRYIASLREITPWEVGKYQLLWRSEPTMMLTFILQSLVASWRRLRKVVAGVWCGGSSPWLGAVVLRSTSTEESRLKAYKRLAHSTRTPAPNEEQLKAEVKLMTAAAENAAEAANGQVPAEDEMVTTTFFPTSKEADCWIHVTLLK